MTSREVTESEIIDVLLGQAAPEVEEQVRASVRSDAEFAAVYDHWARLVPAMKHENVRANEIARNACRQLMEQLREQETPARTPAVLTDAPQRGTMGADRERWFGWRQTAAGLAAAACVVVIVGYLISSAYAPAGSGLQDMQNVRQATKYVDFLYNGADELGTESQPFKTLRDGIATVPSGGVLKIKSGTYDETLRITKPLTLVAVQGEVKIGG